MNLKIYLILLHLFSSTLPISNNAGNSLNVLASTVNDSTSPINKISIITTALKTETCNASYCYKNIDREEKLKNDRLELIQLAKKAGENKTAKVLTNTIPVHLQRNRLISSSMIYGLLTLAGQKAERTQCYNELGQIYDGINRKEIWAIKVLDSSGTPEPGFIMGQNFWLGSIKGCEAVRNPHTLTLSNRFERIMHANLMKSTAPFDIDYRVVYASHTSPWQIQVEFLLDAAKILHVGLCLPKSCSNEQIANLSQEYFDADMLDMQNVLEQNPKVLNVKDLNVKTNFFEKKSVLIVSAFVLFTIIMIIIAYIKEENEKLILATDHLINNNNLVNLENISKIEQKSILNPPDVIAHCRKYSIPKRVSFAEQLISCFSIRQNLSSLISLKTSPNAVPVIDGLKSIGCFLILIFHMNWYMHYTVHNPAMMFAYGETPLWQWVTATPIIVDIFFTISGFLLSYNFLRNTSRIQEIQNNSFWQNTKLFGKQILHRYIRLTPLYLLVCGLTEIATTYLVETSPFWIHDRNDLTCSNYWWRNVFYIQNLFHVNELCLNWTWSMACEMQFFILSTFFLFLYAKFPNAAKGLFCSTFGIFSGLVFAIAFFTKFTPAYDVIHELGTELYIAPWTRVLPYLTGVAAGYFMFSNNGQMPFEQKTVKILWTLCTTLAIMSHISTLHRDISHFLAAPMITAIRILYSGSVAWMIVASASGHGGFFAKFLNFIGFVHLNKLSYAIYLLNPAIISFVFGAKDHSTHVEPFTMTVLSVGVMAIAYKFAFVFSLMFEMPYTRLSGVLWKRNPQTTTKIITQIPIKEYLVK